APRVPLVLRPLRTVATAGAVAASLALAPAGPVLAQTPAETVQAQPRPAAAARLPQPLSPAEAGRYQRIFTLTAQGALEEAAAEAERLEDRRLMGHVLAARWLAPRAAVPDAEALRAWLRDHADHPDAPAIHRLLLRRAPDATPPVPAAGSLSEDAEIVPEERDARPGPRNPALERAVRERGAAGDVAGVQRLIARTRGMTPDHARRLKAEAALALFRAGRDEAAFRMASEVAREGRETTGRAAFAAGLAAWGMERYEVALPYFETAARAPGASASLRAAAAYWTARAAVRARRPNLYVSWMLQAAQEPRTFYGLLARRSLGMPAGFAWEPDVLGQEEAAALAETAGGWRALALLQIGRTDRAEAELRALWPAAQGNAALTRAMMIVAGQAGLTHLSSQLAALAQSADGRPRDFARFPLPQLQPQQGYRVDPSLVYAVARQESNFDPEAVSPAGARGLMQIMPATASYVAGDPTLRGPGARRLHDPALSLELAQRYMLYLTRHEVVGGDLIRLLAAYNAGPGNVARWQPAHRHRGDPLLFIESIPIGETRTYVQRVLAYSWIYASRLRLPSPSLEALARGEFPRFAAPEEVAAFVPPRRAAEAR
ncbi:MAG TPA: lytic transglycosylase domain-containing protein, partial [Acetobacteraceae bacterium]|nr:lytic transglycosylase domain-containing protein [Acetobacteraceae bacterium]